MVEVTNMWRRRSLLRHVEQESRHVFCSRAEHGVYALEHIYIDAAPLQPWEPISERNVDKQFQPSRSPSHWKRQRQLLRLRSSYPKQCPWAFTEPLSDNSQRRLASPSIPSLNFFCRHLRRHRRQCYLLCVRAESNQPRSPCL